MTATYSLRIISQEKQVYEGEVESLVAPGALGYLGVLAHHAPLLTSLTPGKISIRDARGDSREFRVEGGFLEVSAEEAVILTDQIQEESQS
ncbi:MAG: ATP synthase F1 subunit epsilon [Candidatus Omnitrophica bacterium]|nr:ATP synthase F1 subunit epsilon [Candidatus Omnitrophota bacterium]